MDDQVWHNIVETKLDRLERGQVQVESLIDRFDIAIERLTDVSTTVSQLLAVQGSRLEFQEKASDSLSTLLEARRVESELVIKQVYTKIEKVEKDLSKEITHSQKEILSEIKSLRNEQIAKQDSLDLRTLKLEKWGFKILGGGAVVLAILTYFDVFISFIQSTI